MQAVLFFAMLCGCVSAAMGNRTAIPLLASAIFCSWLSWMQAPFNPWFWMGIDLMAAVTIVALRWMDLNRYDSIVLALFLPAWTFYQVGDASLRNWGSFTIVVAQFMLTVPFLRIGAALKRQISRGRKIHDNEHRDYASASFLRF